MKTVEEIVASSPAVTKFLGEEFDIFRMAGDASNREYFRILFAKQQTCTLMLLPEGASSLAEEYEGKAAEQTELPFLDVQKLLRAKNVRVPKIFVVDLPNRMIVLEDLGDTPLIETLATNPEETLKAALVLLARISAPKPHLTQDSVAFKRSFDQDLYIWEFQHYIEYGIEKSISYKHQDIAKIQDLLANMATTYCTWQKHLTHRDYHSKNIHITDEQELAVIDFQDALQGPVYYDLASLLKDAYIQVERSLQEKLALYYQSQLDPAIEDATLSQDEFLYRFDLMSLHRNLKAAGRFVYIDQVKGNAHYLKDVPQALSYAIETLNLHSQLKGLKNVLTPYLQTLIEEV